MVSLFDGCSDSCGWVAAAVAALAYGSFGVPIKETVNIDVHPLILQSYKTVTMFALSWCVLWMGVTVAWTPWGIVSGFMWVLGGTGGIYAIRCAGMAVAVGTWASVMILVNFVCGILLFHEPVASLYETIGAFILLTLGLIGMSHYSAPQVKEKAEDLLREEDIEKTTTATTTATTIGLGSNSSLSGLLENQAEQSALYGGAANLTGGDGNEKMLQSAFVTMSSEDTASSHGTPSTAAIMVAGPLSPADQNNMIHFCGIWWTKRAAGIAGAVFNGLMTGSSLIPLHYAKAQGFGGANYMLSFASGALLTNILIWVAFYFYEYSTTVPRNFAGSRWRQACQNMPLWHLRQLWLPGFAAGVLLTIAMFGTFLSVTYLGQGVGNSIIQSKILIR